MINNSQKMGAVPCLVAPSDILKGNAKVNSIFVAHIFTAFYDMKQDSELEEQPKEKEKVKPNISMDKMDSICEETKEPKHEVFQGKPDQSDDDSGSDGQELRSKKSPLVLGEGTGQSEIDQQIAKIIGQIMKSTREIVKTKKQEAAETGNSGDYMEKMDNQQVGAALVEHMPFIKLAD